MEQENFKIHNYELKEDEAKIAEHVKDMVNRLYGLKGKMIEVNEKIVDIANELRSKYPV